jgi:hypothetical protein
MESVGPDNAMTRSQIIGLSIVSVALAIPAFYFALSAPNSVGFWVAGIGAGLAVLFVRSRMESRATYIDDLLPHVAPAGYEIVSSTPLGWISTGPFPATHVFAQPYVSTTTPFGSGEFVKYRRVVLRNHSGAQSTVYALLEFRAFKCAHVWFKPELKSLHKS